MKSIITALLVLAALAGYAQTKISEVAQFRTETVAFGQVAQNNPVTATFEIKNTSKKPLVIERAMPSCGCTVADYTRTPIAPGKTGTIKATFNAAAAGTFNKAITVKLAGIEEIRELRITGEVIVAKL